MARATSGLPPVPDTAAVSAPRRRGAVATARRLARLVPFNRALLAIEMSVLAVLAGIGDAVTATRLGFRVLDLTLLGIAAVVTVGHLLAILSSSKLRP
jgi:hypothetical protein